MKRIVRNISSRGGKLSYRNLLRFSGIRQDDLKVVLETMIARGDVSVEKGPKGGDVFTLKAAL